MKHIANVARKMKAKREEKGYTQAHLAYLADVHVTTIQNIENNDNLNPHLNTLAKVARGLRVSLAEFLAQP